MYRKMLGFFLCMTVLLVGGCSFLGPAPAVEAAEYDLGIEKVSPIIGVKVIFTGFSNLSGAGCPMLSRGENGVLKEDDTNRFILLPEQLIRRKMTEMFIESSEKDAVRVSGRLWRFEIDHRDSMARFFMEYELRQKENSLILRHNIILPAGGNALEHAIALERCVIKSARQLAGEITAFEKNNLLKGKKK